MGTFLLSVFSKLTDFVLQWGTDAMWEMVTWGPLLKRGEELLTFLALTCDIDGWMHLIFLRPRRKDEPDAESGKSSHNTDAERNTSPAEEGHETVSPSENAEAPERLVQSAEKTTPRLPFMNFRVWSLIRLFLWGAIQFPGIIMMTIVNQENNYIPTNWTPISGGLGVFDTSRVSLVLGNPLLWVYVFFLIRDATMSVQVDPVDTDCQNSDSCASFLFPGGLRAVAPWPYRDTTDKSLKAYITKDAPAYQMDVWEAPSSQQWNTDDCTVYGIDNKTAFQLCISYAGVDTDRLVAGWRICPTTVLPTEGCNQAGSWSGSHTWSTYLSFNPRLATIAFDRFTSRILSVLSLSPPTPQHIPPRNFSAAINAMLCPLTDGSLSTTSTYCQGEEALAQPTTAIQGDILEGSAAPTSAIPLDDLRNLFAASLIFFNPVTSGLESGPRPYSVQPGLPAENYVLGSIARPVMFVAPEPWTAVAYAAVMGGLLVLMWSCIGWAWKNEPRRIRPFPFLQFLRLKWGGGRDGIDLQERFEKDRSDEKRSLLEDSSEIKLKLVGNEMLVEIIADQST